MRKLLALLLAVSMMAAMSVVAMAGGGGDETYQVVMTNMETGERYYLNESLDPGEKLQLQLQYDDGKGHSGVWTDVTWESTDTSRITISGNVVTYLDADGDDAKVRITPHVSSIPAGVDREPYECYGYILLGGKTRLYLQTGWMKPLAQGDTVTLTATVKNIETGEEIAVNEGDIIWSSSNPDDVSIEKTGPRTAVATMKSGERGSGSDITAEYYDKNGYKRTDDEYLSVSWTSTTPTKPSHPSSTPTESTESPRESERDSNTAAQEAAVDAIEAANDGKSTSKVQNVATAAGATVPAVQAKLYGLSANLSVDTMETLASGKTGMKVNLDNGAAEVLIPAGFTMPKNTGVLAYPLGHQKDPYGANLMKAAVKEDSAKTEIHKLGAGVLPTTATVTIKTKLSGKVNVYYWNEETRKATLVASPTADGKKVTFATKQLGNLILTTGTI